MSTPALQEATVRPLAGSVQWRVSDIICRAGPDDAPFEEAHEGVSVAVVLNGAFVYRSSQGRALMTPGSILLGNHRACFSCSHEHGRGDRCVAFHTSPELVDEIAGDIKGLRRTRFEAHRLAPHETLAPIFSSARALLGDFAGPEAEAAVIAVVGRALALAHDGEAARVTLSDERRMSEAVAFINARHADPLSLGDMAEAVGLRRHHFLRVFRRVVGVTPYQYLLGRRIEAAVVRLRDGQGDVLAVALACGFGDLSDFTRRFTRRMGVSPGAFSRRHGGGPPVAARRRPAAGATGS